MEEFLFEIFLSEIRRQCEFSFIALRQIELGLQNNNVEIVWYNLQNFLISVANISKILWPNQNYKRRGEKLRQRLKISEDSLIKSRKFRNHFEHFDERLDEWFKATENYNYVDSNIGDIKTINGIDVKDILRNFNPKNFELIFRGEKYELQPVIKEINEIYFKVKFEIK
ncbi:hypothetical protein [Marinitoga sp. 1154]|nr:hypothetical protein [Marinitoga sp. 1154]